MMNVHCRGLAVHRAGTVSSQAGRGLAGGVANSSKLVGCRVSTTGEPRQGCGMWFRGG